MVDAESGAPLPGVRVSFIDSGGFGIYSTRAFTTTDAAGHYDLTFEYEGGDWPSIWTNSLGTLERGCFFISHSGGPSGRVEPGRRTERNIELKRNHYYDPIGQPLAYPSPIQCITAFGRGATEVGRPGGSGAQR